jgi:hypothetical protein
MDSQVLTIEKYGRFFGVYQGKDLVCVCVYKKGAMEVVRRLLESFVIKRQISAK